VIKDKEDVLSVGMGGAQGQAGALGRSRGWDRGVAAGVWVRVGARAGAWART
jgi:hypothetical protein